MMHLTVGGKSLLSGELVTAMLVEYAALLGRRGSTDAIHLEAIGPDGSEVTATILLNDGLAFVAETTSSDAPEPDNAELEEYLRARIEQLGDIGSSDPVEIAGAALWDRGADGAAAH